jgi:hypothetical protein
MSVAHRPGERLWKAVGVLNAKDDATRDGCRECQFERYNLRVTALGKVKNKSTICPKFPYHTAELKGNAPRLAMLAEPSWSSDNGTFRQGYRQ